MVSEVEEGKEKNDFEVGAEAVGSTTEVLMAGAVEEIGEGIEDVVVESSSISSSVSPCCTFFSGGNEDEEAAVGEVDG